MTNDEMRIVIAEKCGWTDIDFYEDDAGPSFWSGIPPATVGADANNEWKACTAWDHKRLPDYPNDLNAMHEAEKTMTGNQFVEYIRKLKYVCNPGCNLTNEHNQFSHVTATARQRAEAFIKTVCPEKWKGNE